MSENALLQELLLKWRTARDAGQLLSAEDLCQKAPQLRSLLEAEIKNQLLHDYNGVNATRFVPVEKSTGWQLDDYEILAKIGAGGMGDVYKARHTRMDRIVALKIVSKNALGDDSSVRRFEQEVRAAAKLSHPNIVAAYDAREHQGVHYLVMEYVAGSDLGRYVKQNGPLSIEMATDCIIQAATALGYAHSQGIMHRDVKPSNLILDSKGVIKVLDMGLARITDASRESTDEALTSTGSIMGTLDFMSPEQAVDAKRTDARSDIYSLGCTLYYLLTGRPVFDGEVGMNKLWAHKQKPAPKLSATIPAVSTQFDSVLAKMLAKEPDSRYQNTKELIAALKGVSSASSAHAVEIEPCTLLDHPDREKSHEKKPKSKSSRGRNSASTPKKSIAGRLRVGGLSCSVSLAILALMLATSAWLFVEWFDEGDPRQVAMDDTRPAQVRIPDEPSSAPIEFRPIPASSLVTPSETPLPNVESPVKGSSPLPQPSAIAPPAKSAPLMPQPPVLTPPAKVTPAIPQPTVPPRSTGSGTGYVLFSPPSTGPLAALPKTFTLPPHTTGEKSAPVTLGKLDLNVDDSLKLQLLTTFEGVKAQGATGAGAETLAIAAKKPYRLEMSANDKQRWNVVAKMINHGVSKPDPDQAVGEFFVDSGKLQFQWNDKIEEAVADQLRSSVLTSQVGTFKLATALRNVIQQPPITINLAQKITNVKLPEAKGLPPKEAIWIEVLSTDHFPVAATFEPAEKRSRGRDLKVILSPNNPEVRLDLDVAVSSSGASLRIEPVYEVVADRSEDFTLERIDKFKFNLVERAIKGSEGELIVLNRRLASLQSELSSVRVSDSMDSNAFQAAVAKRGSLQSSITSTIVKSRNTQSLLTQLRAIRDALPILQQMAKVHERGELSYRIFYVVEGHEVDVVRAEATPSRPSTQ